MCVHAKEDLESIPMRQIFIKRTVWTQIRYPAATREEIVTTSTKNSAPCTRRRPRMLFSAPVSAANLITHTLFYSPNNALRDPSPSYHALTRRRRIPIGVSQNSFPLPCHLRVSRRRNIPWNTQALQETWIFLLSLLRPSFSHRIHSAYLHDTLIRYFARLLPSPVLISPRATRGIACARQLLREHISENGGGVPGEYKLASYRHLPNPSTILPLPGEGAHTHSRCIATRDHLCVPHQTRVPPDAHICAFSVHHSDHLPDPAATCASASHVFKPWRSSGYSE